MKRGMRSALVVAPLFFLAVGALYLRERNQEKSISEWTHSKVKPRPIITLPPMTPTPKENALQTAYARFQTGDYAGAVYVLRLELTAHPDDPVLKKNLATALFALGLFRLQQNNVTEAESLFEEAAELGHFDSEHILATLRLKSGQLDSAAALFDDLYKQSKDVGVLKLLVDMSLSQDNLLRAENLLQKMKEADLSEEDSRFLTERIKQLNLKKSFARNEEVIDTGNVQVAYSEPSMRSAAKAVASGIESVLEDLYGYLGALPSSFHMRAVVYPSESFQNSNLAPPWAGAFFDGIIRVPARRGRLTSHDFDVLKKLAQHEGSHAYFFAHCGTEIPSWIGEGLAQKFEHRQSLQNVLSMLPFTDGIKSLNAPLPESLDSNFASASADNVNALYRRAFLLTEVLALQNGGDLAWKTVFQNYCVNKVPLFQALKDQFGAGTAEELWTANLAKIVSLIPTRR